MVKTVEFEQNPFQAKKKKNSVSLLGQVVFFSYFCLLYWSCFGVLQEVTSPLWLQANIRMWFRVCFWKTKFTVPLCLFVEETQVRISVHFFCVSQWTLWVHFLLYVFVDLLDSYTKNPFSPVSPGWLVIRWPKTSAACICSSRTNLWIKTTPLPKSDMPELATLELFAKRLGEKPRLTWTLPLGSKKQTEWTIQLHLNRSCCKPRLVPSKPISLKI